MRGAWVLVIVGGAAVGAPRAEACSCMPSTVERRTLPADGARDFPLDGRVRVLIGGGLSDAVLEGMLAEYRLRDAAGALVPLLATRQGRVLTFAPRAPLAPRARYVVERAFAYDARGDLLSDDDRWFAARVSGPAGARARRPAVRRWFAEGAFTTGARGGEALAQGPSARAATLSFAHGGGDCGPGGTLVVDYDRGALRATDLVGVELEGIGVVAVVAHAEASRAPAGGRYRLAVGDTACEPDPVHVPARTDLRVRLVVLAADGRARPEPRFVAVVPQGSPPAAAPALIDPRGTARTATLARGRVHAPRGDAAVTAAFFAAPLDEPRAAEVAPADGPAGCPYGLESAGVWPLPPGTVAWMRGASPSAGPRGATVYASAEGGAVRVEVDEGGRTVRTPLAGAGDAAVAAFAEDATWVASLVGASIVRVARYDRAGRAVWTRDVADDGGLWPRIAAGGGRVMVVWGATRRDRVGWAIVGARDGAVTARGSVDVRDLDAAAAVAFDGRAFVLAWTPREGPAVQWARIDGAGKLGPLAAVDGPPTSGFAWAVGGGRAALVAAFGASRVEWVPLDDPMRSVRLDRRGVERAWAPAAAVSGARTYVAWQGWHRGWITVVDAAGRRGPRTALAGGEPITAPALAADDAGVYAVYGAASSDAVGAHPRVERLRCATSPPPGAPERLHLSGAR